MVEQFKRELAGGWRTRWIVLFLLAAMIAVMRLRTYGEPVNRDPATYSIIARELLNGKRLYADTWDSKPPLIFATYAAAQSVAGFGYSAIWLLSVVGAILAMLGVCYAASAVSRRYATGLIAAGAFALAASDYRLQGNEANTELFMNACLAWGFGLLLRLRPGGSHLRRALAVGLLVSVASLYKTVAIAHALAFGAAYLACHRKPLRVRLALQQVAAMVLGAAVPWGIVLGWAAARGSLGDLVDAVFGYNRFYSTVGGSGIVGNVARSFLPGRFAPPAMLVALPLAIIVLLGLATARRRVVLRPVILLGAYMVASHVAVALPGQFSAHYYQLWLPPLCIAAAWSCLPISRWFLKRGLRWQWLPAAVLLLALAKLQLPLLALSADDWSTIKYGADPLIERSTAAEIAGLLRPGETFYVWGSVPGLYYFADKRPPSAFFFIGPLLAGPLSDMATQRLVHDLSISRPELLVLDERDVPPMPRHGAVEWFRQHYRPLARDSVSGRFAYWSRIGGRLAGTASVQAGDQAAAGSVR